MKFIKIVLALTILLAGPKIASATTTKPATASLAVPFVWEIPDGVWVKPWNNACEEASVVMVEQFYLPSKKQNFSRSEMKNLMWPLFGIEDSLFGSNADTNSTRTAKLINYYTSFSAEIKTNPTIEEIKTEILAGRPVISLHYGLDLNNPFHRWRRGGSSYHMMVIKGFDEATEEFIINDPELKNGLDYRYKFATIMASLHDFNHTTKRADGPPVVLFTKPKQIVRASGFHQIYLVVGDTKYYISNPKVFKTHRWSWGLIQEVEKSYLDSLKTGTVISK